MTCGKVIRVSTVHQLSDMDHEKRKRKTEQSVGTELFGLVERDQGYAFISDAIGELPAEKVFDIARGALKHTEATAKKIRSFLQKYGEQP